MSAQLQETLRAAYVTRFGPGPAAEPEARASAAHQWLFTATKGGIMDADAFRQRVFLPLLKGAQLRHIRMHDLRHTYASLLLAPARNPTTSSSSSGTTARRSHSRCTGTCCRATAATR